MFLLHVLPVDFGDHWTILDPFFELSKPFLPRSFCWRVAFSLMIEEIEIFWDLGRLKYTIPTIHNIRVRAERDNKSFVIYATRGKTLCFHPNIFGAAQKH